MKHTAVSLGLALALTATGALAADVSGSFVGSSPTFMTGFASDAGVLTASVLSSFTGKAGYDISSVEIDGKAIADLLPGMDDYYFFSAPVLSGFHTITVFGKPYGGSFVGSYEVTAVPEPSAEVLALVGMGLVGGLAYRSRR